MKTKSFWVVFLAYMKRHRRIIAAFFVSVAMFAFVFSLYSLEAEAVLYATFLSIIAMSLMAGYGFWRYYENYKTLCRQFDKITVGIDGLPHTIDLTEQVYQSLIEEIHRDKTELVSKADINRSEMVDYYTLWAHQIKTPIAAMRVLLQSGEAGGSAELTQELFKIERYVEIVLGYLRMESMSSDLMLGKYEIFKIVKQAVKKYAAVFIHKKIRLELQETECTVLTDEKWLVFVIEQLLSNALKYTKEGTISIYMDETAEKTLVVEDTGIGIQAEDLPRVFEKGFTGYNGHMDKKSTGIGLYLCKRILSKLSHTIAITSTVGKGTKIKIDLYSEEIPRE